MNTIGQRRKPESAVVRVQTLAWLQSGLSIVGKRNATGHLLDAKDGGRKKKLVRGIVHEFRRCGQPIMLVLSFNRMKIVILDVQH